LVIAIGLVLDRPRMIAVGLVFHVGEGIPAYVLDAIAGGESSITSVLLHTVPVASAAWALWGRRLPRGILVRAWLVHPSAMVAAYVLADPTLNVMLVQKPWEVTASLFPALWMSWVANLTLSLMFVAAGWLVVRLAWRRWE